MIPLNYGPEYSPLGFIGMCYMTWAVQYATDEYLIPSTEQLVERLKLGPSIAGLTFVALSGSMPLLLISFIGTFIIKSNVAFGTVIGCAAFNTLLTIGCCSIVSVVNLTPYSFLRDSACYIISLAVLSIFYGVTSKHFIEWWEALILLFLYIAYILFICYKELILWFKVKKYETHSKVADTEQEPLEPLEPEYDEKDDNYDEDEVENEEEDGIDLAFPTKIWDRIKFIISAPILYLLYYTLPTPKKYWLITLIGSMIYLFVFSFLLVLCVRIVSSGWNVDDEIIGFVFVAIFLCVTDLKVALILTRMGVADMAILSSFSSSIFDILIVLPFPWLIYSVSNNGQIDVDSKSMFISMVILIGITLIMMVVFKIINWTLTKSVGCVIVFVWIAFVVHHLFRYFVYISI